MFGRSRETKATKVAAKFATDYIQLQLKSVDFNDKYETAQDVISDHFFVGYVFGVCDCALQAYKVKDDIKGIGGMTSVCLNLFGQEAGPEIVGKMLAMMKKMTELPEFHEGVMSGGKDAADMLGAMFDKADPPDPMGLAKHLQQCIER